MREVPVKHVLITYSKSDSHLCTISLQCPVSAWLKMGVLEKCKVICSEMTKTFRSEHCWIWKSLNLNSDWDLSVSLSPYPKHHLSKYRGAFGEKGSFVSECSVRMKWFFPKCFVDTHSDPYHWRGLPCVCVCVRYLLIRNQILFLTYVNLLWNSYSYSPNRNAAKLKLA